MNPGRTKKRIFWVCLFVCLLFSGYSMRLVCLQINSHEKYTALADKKNITKTPIFARRGRILDSKGEVLADDCPVGNVIADCSIMTDIPATAAITAGVLELSETELLEKFATGRRYIILKRQVPEILIRDLKSQLALQRLRGIYSEDSTIRVYPNGPELSHVIGFTNREHAGVEGIERSMDGVLSGENGYRYSERDGTGREIVLYRGSEKQPRNGATVRLTIDLGLQHLVEQELEAAFAQYQPRSAVAVVLDPRTGEVLAMSTRPNFDPNNAGDADPESRKNRAIADMVEPGSTFKIVPVGAALQEGNVKPETIIYCEGGRFPWGGRILNDHHPYGNLSVHDIIVKSSNIGVAKLAIQMGEQRFHEYIRRYGFGEKTGIELPGEISGMVNAPNKWSKLEITRIPMGHSVCVTPIQLARAFAAIANDGVMMKTRIVRSVTDANGGLLRDFPPVRMREVISKAAANKLRDAMVEVVSPRGTAVRASVECFRVAGKTGTAQRVDPNGGYTPGKYVVSFAGFIPANDPRMAVVILLDDARTAPGENYGGLVAAPIFARIAEKAVRYLDLTPEAIPVNKTPLPLAQADISRD